MKRKKKCKYENQLKKKSSSELQQWFDAFRKAYIKTLKDRQKKEQEQKKDFTLSKEEQRQLEKVVETAVNDILQTFKLP